MARRPLSPMPRTAPTSELIAVGAAAFLLATSGCAPRSHSMAPTCGPCCHGGRNHPECQQQYVQRIQPPPDPPPGDGQDAGVQSAPWGGDAGAPVDVSQRAAADAGHAPDGGSAAVRPNPDQEYLQNGRDIRAPTCGPRCHQPRGGAQPLDKGR